MLASEKIAIAAHLHVLLRRKTGRVTDTEWMAQNLEYAAEIVRFARVKAMEDGHPDLAEWAGKLERAMAEPQKAVSRPLAQAAVAAVRQNNAVNSQPGNFADSRGGPASVQDEGAEYGQSAFAESQFLESSLEPGKPRKPRDPNAPRYVGGIR
ncbi:MAG: hypothetical protein H7346_13615 [Burkholderiaceae bacterium]|nr:hypothetical protein [Burkholderiaceae bacterium]